MIKVDIIASYQLSEEDKLKFGSDCNLLKVYHNNELIICETDNGEPEDNTFLRDYFWIKEALLKMYEIGKAEIDKGKE